MSELHMELVACVTFLAEGISSKRIWAWFIYGGSKRPWDLDDNESMDIPWFAWDILAEGTRELTGI